MFLLVIFLGLSGEDSVVQKLGIEVDEDVDGDGIVGEGEGGEGGEGEKGEGDKDGHDGGDGQGVSPPVSVGVVRTLLRPVKKSSRRFLIVRCASLFFFESR